MDPTTPVNRGRSHTAPVGTNSPVGKVDLAHIKVLTTLSPRITPRVSKPLVSPGQIRTPSPTTPIDEDAVEADEYQCRCTKEIIQNSLGTIPNDPVHQQLFHHCWVCKRRPAERLCLACWEAHCEEHSHEHFNKTQHSISLHYLMETYTELLWCFRCNQATMCDAADNIVEIMFESKVEFLDDPVRDKIRQEFQLPWGGVYVSSMQGWRGTLEDSHIVMPQLPSHTDLGLFSVFDGHNGTKVARFAAANFARILDSQSSLPHNIPVALQETFLGVDSSLKESEDGPGTTGATAIALVMTPTTLTVANAGDCRVVVCCVDGNAEALSTDHRPSLPSEALRISTAGSNVINNRVDGILGVSRALGDFDWKQANGVHAKEQAITAWPDITTRPRKNDDRFIVVACDGVWDSMDSQTVSDFLRFKLQAGVSPACALDDLLDACLATEVNDDGVGADNMTAILLHFK